MIFPFEISGQRRTASNMADSRKKSVNVTMGIKISASKIKMLIKEQ